MNDAAKTLILCPAGETVTVEALAQAVDAGPVRELEAAAGDGALRIAGALTAAERVIEAERPGAVILCGRGPEVGAAALVAAKLDVALARVSADAPAEGDAPADLADLDTAVADRLADLVVPAGADPEAAADAIRAWLATSGPPR
jgi:hypothetical protein